MRQSREFFRENAVPTYLEGLRKTGIPLDRIPRVSEMDQALQEFGWGAVPVCGFIPPIAFLDLQARGILPIATDMRSIDHIAYTPAPDIVHEAAGHAPIIADPAYRAYLRQYAAMANKTIMSREDLNLYEAIRVLSDIKENPDTKPGEVAAAQKKLDVAIASVKYVSEAAKVSRMAWWTVEYGLVGPLNNPKIYGAGLLSSVGESQACLSNRVRKIPLTVKCVETTFDITEPQPQLFVASEMSHLTEVLKELEVQLSFSKGGVHGLEEARMANTVNTVVLSNGLEVSGILDRYEALVNQDQGVPHFIGFSGPVQLCVKGLELEGQGRGRHGHGFSTPLGRWVGAIDQAPQTLTDGELAKLGLVVGGRAKLGFTNGFQVEGQIQRIVRNKATILYITWVDCTVRRGSTTYFEPAWGEFDMAVADQVLSVYGGPSDREAYGEYDMGGVSTQPGRTSPFTSQEKKLFTCYTAIRESRTKHSSLVQVAETVTADHQDEWLLHLELLESIHLGCLPPESSEALRKNLDVTAKKSEPATADLIQKGLKIASTPD